jgi:hypothetical protein
VRSSAFRPASRGWISDSSASTPCWGTCRGIGLAGAGYALGEHWRSLERFIQPLAIALGILLLSALVWWIAKRLRANRVEPTEKLP